ncbi:mCG148239 [Mus musculus]|nr:mCG148239 [Mus musculus]
MNSQRLKGHAQDPPFDSSLQILPSVQRNPVIFTLYMKQFGVSNYSLSNEKKDTLTLITM